MNHQREPIKNTCPTIDKYIRSIKSAIKSRSEISKIEDDYALDLIQEINSELESCIDYLEDLRQSNDTLRKWALSEAESYDELQIEYSQLQAELNVTKEFA